MAEIRYGTVPGECCQCCEHSTVYPEVSLAQTDLLDCDRHINVEVKPYHVCDLFEKAVL